MTFVLGFICGVVFGCCLTFLAYTALRPITQAELDEMGVSMFPLSRKRCPPCDAECEQGRDCPAREERK